MINLIAKIMHVRGTMTPAQVSEIIKLPKLIVRVLVEDMVKLRLVESRGLVASEDIKSDIRYALTDRGKSWALEAMLVSQYVGPAPVTLEAFERQILCQGIANERISRETLQRALSHLVLPTDIMPQLGPAVNSGRSILLYGEPGNGKTSIAEALSETFRDTIYYPYAIEVDNQVIQFFDETLHDRQEGADDAASPLDARWVRCRRPVLVAGGELTLDMLDLSFEQTSRFYEAPMHLKALGGVFVLDDFGRQRQKPQDFLNRWIVPLEKNFDIMSLHTGKKFRVPFDQLVIFSSNIPPHDIADEASLRRIYFKVRVPSPSRENYLEIFRRVCRDEDIPYDERVLAQFYKDKYDAKNLVPSGAHPGFLLRHIIAACIYLGREPEVSRELLELAWCNVAASQRTKETASMWGL
ncbi:ATPase [Actibacterium sp. MT2.3-13A]|uniref:ATP-binding protein n=1 Tax=Actibacterium sp. MT2.3-13A TaxID=2828332 RepID=UPI001BA52E44|nr:ATPase [Actibacterium sp. MT2.3-13A]